MGPSQLPAEVVVNAVIFRLIVTALCFIPLTVQSTTTSEVTQEKVTEVLPKLEKLAGQTLKQTGVPGMAIVIVYNRL
jgi:hypothetical protein